MKLGDLKLRTKMFSGNVISLLLIIILGGVTFNATNSLLKTGDMVDHTHVVIARASSILASAVDMETGMRGYLLAGEDGFLDPYINGHKVFLEEIGDLKELVSDNPAQVTLLTEIEQNISAWKKNVTEPTIQLRREIGNAKNMDDMADLVGEGKGKVYFDKFRGQIATFIVREEKLLAKRSSQSSSYDTDSAKLVLHTQNVIKESMRIEASAVDMETGMRGFLLAGQEEFLAPYNAGSKLFFEKVGKLKKTVSDNSAQVTLLTEIERNISSWKTDVTEPTIELRKTIGDAKTMNDMADLVGEAKGKAYFDKFRNQVSTFIERERSLMVSRQQEAVATARNAKITIVIGTLVIIVISLFVSTLISNLITKPITKAVNLSDSLAQGDMTKRLEVDTTDEVGDLSTSLNKIADDLGAMLKQVQSSSNILTDSSGTLTTLSGELSKTSDETSQRANNVASASEQMSTNMNSVSAAMEQSASNVGMVATAAEEMSATVNEIAQNAAKAKNISEGAVVQSEKTSLKMNDLGKAADKIGKVTETITEISEQTNLLALNATIEAARAGEAGKGFAVVANEIKDLAKQTADATVDIKNQIGEMQGTTKSTIEDIETISEVINEINEVITTIATAVEEQSAATSEISENVAQAAAGIGEVNENVAQSSAAISDVNQDISEISQGAGEINKSSQHLNQNANELSKLAEELNTLMSRFKIS